MATSAKDLKKKLNLSPDREAKIADRAATLIAQELHSGHGRQAQTEGS